MLAALAVFCLFTRLPQAFSNGDDAALAAAACGLFAPGQAAPGDDAPAGLRLLRLQ